MKLAPILLAAPAILQLVAAGSRLNEPYLGRAVDRWNYPRQDSTSNAGGGATGVSTAAGGGATNTQQSTNEATSTTPTQPETTSTTPAETSTANPAKTTAAQPATSSQVQQTSPQVQPTSQSQQTSQSQAQQTSEPSSQQQQQQTSQAQASSSTTHFIVTTPPPTSSAIVTTDNSGKVISSIVVITLAPTSVAAAQTSKASTGSKPVSQATVIGLAVTGGVAGLIIILLIVWKLTNKRFSDLDDAEDDAIKWPELNKDSAAMTPLPTRPTGRAGAETSALDDFDHQSAAHSTADLPYQPYSDDPGYGTHPAYYDPYGGAPGVVRPFASPPGSHDGDHKNWGAPAEGQYYDMPRGDSRGRASPALPNTGYADHMGRTASPAPSGYGYAPDSATAGDPYGGRHSPGPNLAYGTNQSDRGVTDAYGRRSPGPGLAYSGAVGRVGSPAPNAAHDQGGYR